MNGAMAVVRVLLASYVQRGMQPIGVHFDLLG